MTDTVVAPAEIPPETIARVRRVKELTDERVALTEKRETALLRLTMLTHVQDAAAVPIAERAAALAEVASCRLDVDVLTGRIHATVAQIAECNRLIATERLSALQTTWDILKSGPVDTGVKLADAIQKSGSFGKSMDVFYTALHDTPHVPLYAEALPAEAIELTLRALIDSGISAEGLRVALDRVAQRPEAA